MAAGAPARSCMGIVDEAARLEREGAAVIHLEKGELDLDTPEEVKELAIGALRRNRTRYSHSSGLPELRQAICDYHSRRYRTVITPDRVLVYPGSSAAMLELFLALLDPGDEVIVPAPGYPAYPHFVAAAHGQVARATSAGAGFRHTAELAAPLVRPATKAIIINFPSNPVGDVAGPRELRAFADLGPLVVSDEAYHGLAFGRQREHSILEYTGNAVVVGTFSKGYAMTGWRLGYLIVPSWLAPRLIRMHEYLFVGTCTFTQQAAVGALRHADAIQGLIRAELRRRQECLLERLCAAGLPPVLPPQGGFYTFARLPAGTGPSAAFAAELLDRAQVAVTPGSEFGPGSEDCVRFSVSAPADHIVIGIDRLGRFLQERGSA